MCLIQNYLFNYEAPVRKLGLLISGVRSGIGVSQHLHLCWPRSDCLQTYEKCSFERVNCSCRSCVGSLSLHRHGDGREDGSRKLHCVQPPCYD
ncbi:hypothetical protein ScPMuIL_005068 [Solemya velum]